ncbi:multicopper oxidase domain-containing protein [Tardiphaga sp.]|uniref:multicopper oxidase family protein n=1 Tax=Tardiphaga sp. TaxID=1926292 RepID=UPI0025D0C264|nr:multicopper oxidase domain-containing protein [Tardiphaga sp.]
MTQPVTALTRRTLIAAISGTILSPWLPASALAQTRRRLALQAGPGSTVPRPGAATATWQLGPAPADGPPRFRRGDEIDVSFQNRLPIALALNWTGITGTFEAEALLGRLPVAAGGTDAFRLRPRHAGTCLVDTRLLGDGQSHPSPACALVVEENEPVAVDRDVLWLIEDVRLRDDNSAIAPGTDPKDTTALFTINGKASLELTARPHERLRLRIINGCQRNVIAIRIEGYEVRVMAIDGQPAEPFLARNSQLVLAPGTRIDAFVDVLRPGGSATTILLHDGREPRPIASLIVSGEAPIRPQPLPPAAPLPSNGLPARLDLKNALRVDLPLQGPDWIRPVDFATRPQPAFRAKAGRTIVLALGNRGTSPAVFHLNGHHFRLLDRLDDGWKPYWLDTLLIEASQTQRIALMAENTGRWLMQVMAADWAAPRLLRWYEVG